MAKVLFGAGLVLFFGALCLEIAFIMLRLTAASGDTAASPTSFYGLAVWGCIGAGILCWIIAAAIVITNHFRNGT
jgi:uncharacterized membrane protein YvlD (DUF360 family)